MPNEQYNYAVNLQTQVELTALERMEQTCNQINQAFNQMQGIGSAALTGIEQRFIGAASAVAAFNAQIAQSVRLIQQMFAPAPTMQIPSYFGQGTQNIPIAAGALPQLGERIGGPPVPPIAPRMASEVPLGGNATLLIPAGGATSGGGAPPRDPWNLYGRFEGGWDSRFMGASGAGAGGRARSTFDDFERGQNNVMGSMIRHVAVYWILFRAVEATIGAMTTLSQRVLDVDAAARRMQFITGGTYAQGQQMAMAGMETAARFGLDPAETIQSTIQAARFAPRSTAAQQKLVEEAVQISFITGEKQAEAMARSMEIRRQWNLTEADAGRIADMAAMALKTSTVNLDEFMTSMSEGASVGQAFNMTMEETGGLIAGISEATGRGPSRVISFLQMAAGLEKRPEDESRILRDVGISTRDTQMNALPLLDVLEQLHDKWGQLSDDQRRQAGLSLFGQRYLSDFYAVMANYDSLISKVKEFESANGEAARATELQMQSIQSQWNRIGPAIQTAITAALTPTNETAEKWSNFFKWLADGAMKAADDIRKARLAEQFLTSTERGLEMDPDYSMIPEVARRRDVMGRIDENAEMSRKTGGDRWQELGVRMTEAGIGTPGTSAITGGPTAATPQRTLMFQALSKANLQYEDFGSKQLDAYKSKIDQVAATYLGFLAKQDESGRLVDETNKAWADQVKLIMLESGQIELLTGKYAALYDIAKQMEETTTKRPTIQSMPELNQQRAGQLQSYITQYERLFTQLGVKQTPQEYLMFGQGGALYKYTTSSEAMTMAMELLREEIKKNTEEQGKLRGSYNIPTAYGYRPPTQWEYYDAGNKDMGPVNYPWMFGGKGMVDKDGKPMLGMAATGITKEFTSTLQTDATRANTTALNNLTAAIISGPKSAIPSAGIGAGEQQPVAPDYYDDYFQRRYRAGKRTGTGGAGIEESSRLGALIFPEKSDQTGTGARGKTTGGPAGLVALADEMSKKYGMTDPNILRAIIQAESQWNPNAVGDAGASIGLLQNHMRGGRGTGYTKEQLLDPRFNLELGMPEISSWYRRGTAAGLSGADLARYVGQHAQRPAAGMEQNYAKAYENLRVQGIDQMNGSMSRLSGSFGAVQSNTNVLPRLAGIMANGVMLQVQSVVWLAKIAATVGKAPVVNVTVQQDGQATTRGEGATSGGASAVSGANAGGWRR